MKCLSGFLIALLGFAAHASEPAEVRDGILVDQLGRTLYVFDVDAPGRSSCGGNCAIVWPPFAATSEDSGTGKFQIILRDDGSRQWTYRGKPLYRYIIDKRPGDTTGENRGGVWHALRPQIFAKVAQRNVDDRPPAFSY